METLTTRPLSEDHNLTPLATRCDFQHAAVYVRPVVAPTNRSRDKGAALLTSTHSQAVLPLDTLAVKRATHVGAVKDLKESVKTGVSDQQQIVVTRRERRKRGEKSNSIVQKKTLGVESSLRRRIFLSALWSCTKMLHSLHCIVWTDKG